MSALTMRAVDVTSDDEIREWHAVVDRVARHEVGDHAVAWSVQELTVVVREKRKQRRNELFFGEVDGRVVAAGEISLPLLDNLTAAEVGLWVLPEERRHGHGSALLRGLEARAAELGRTRLDAMVEYPYAGPPDGAGVAGVEFGRVHGYRFGYGDVQRELALPVDEAVVVRHAEAAAPHHADYELRTFSGPVPDDIVVSWLELSTTLMTEAPSGDNEYEDEAVDVEAQRQGEAMMAKQGRTAWRTVALAPDGKVVAHTDLVVTAPGQPWVFQWGTLVHRDHRGHRLGMAVKAANLLALQRSGEDLRGRRVVTWNAEVNDHMIAINEELGFVKAARAAELQKKA